MADTNKILDYNGLETNIKETKKWVRNYVGTSLSDVAQENTLTNGIQDIRGNNPNANMSYILSKINENQENIEEIAKILKEHQFPLKQYDDIVSIYNNDRDMQLPYIARTIDGRVVVFDEERNFIVYNTKGEVVTRIMVPKPGRYYYGLMDEEGNIRYTSVVNLYWITGRDENQLPITVPYNKSCTIADTTKPFYNEHKYRVLFFGDMSLPFTPNGENLQIWTNLNITNLYNDDKIFRDYNALTGFSLYEFENETNNITIENDSFMVTEDTGIPSEFDSNVLTVIPEPIKIVGGYYQLPWVNKELKIPTDTPDKFFALRAHDWNTIYKKSPIYVHALPGDQEDGYISFEDRFGNKLLSENGQVLGIQDSNYNGYTMTTHGLEILKGVVWERVSPKVAKGPATSYLGNGYYLLGDMYQNFSLQQFSTFLPIKITPINNEYKLEIL